MAKKAIIIIILITAAALSVYYFGFRNNNEAENVFRTTGIIEAREVDIESKVAGRLVYIGFREGDSVGSGELVARVDPSELDAVRSQALASLKTAEKTLAAGYDAVENARARQAAAHSEAKRAEAGLQSAKAQLDQSEKDLARARELYERGVTPKSELDQAVTAHDTSRAGVDAAAAALESARAGANAARAALSEAESNVGTLKARLAEAGSALRLAEVRLGDTEIYSPLDAAVDYRYLEPGEMVAPGSAILTLVDTNDLWARIDVDERYVGRIRTGQSAEIALEYMPERVFEGTVFDIGREGGFATERDVTRGRQDIKTFRTRVRVKDPEGILKPGMTVIVTVPVK